LYFHGHYDVVPATREGQFEPRVDGDRLYGRGSSDMKSGLVAMVFAARALVECGIELRDGLRLLCVPDEETGGSLGSGWLSEQGLLGENGIGMLTPEPTSGVIWGGSRGAITLRVTIGGRPAHVALEHEGVNAFEQMLTVAAALLDLKREVAERMTSFRVDPEPARRSILMLGGECVSGTSFNTVPGSCSFTVERRFNPEEDLDTERQRLFDLFDHWRQRGVELRVDLLQEGDSSAAREDSELARVMAESVREVTGAQPRFELCPGLLETRYYAGREVPALAYGPGILSVSHGPQEYVRIDEILRCALVYALAAARLLGA
jgi:acetylornithine deacetylase/succinyl-diaminopimelate desuccinylase-like protein